MSQSVEIEPLRTYVVISLQFSALVQGLMLAVNVAAKLLSIRTWLFSISIGSTLF